MKQRLIQEAAERQEILDAEQLQKMVGVPSFEYTKDLIAKFKLATENNDLDEN
jgi:hypothetical protein